MNELTFDANGRRVIDGKTVREWSWFVGNDTALPSVLSLSGTGASTFFGNLTTAGNQGELVVNNNTAGIDARLSWAWAITATNITEIGWFVYDLRFDVNGPTDTVIQPSIALQVAGSQGVWAGHVADGSFASIIHNSANGGASEQNVEQFDFANYGRGQGKQNVGLIYRPLEKRFYLTAGDENTVMFSRRPATLTNFPSGGVLTPSIGFKNVNGAAHYMRIGGVKLRVVTG